jgi:hypothetical protein
MIKMAVQFTNIPVQTVDAGAGILFAGGGCDNRRGWVYHRDGSGVFTLKGANGQCRASYLVRFDANVAIATGETVEPITVAITYDGEVLGNAVATVTPVAVGDVWHLSISVLIDIPCGCCVSIGVRNISDTAAIDVTGANLILDRIA